MRDHDGPDYAIAIKLLLFRTVGAVGRAVDSAAVRADAVHHWADATTSAAASIGISVARLGGPGWETADDYAALLASVIIVANGLQMVRAAGRDLLDRAPHDDLWSRVAQVARGVPGVRATENCASEKPDSVITSNFMCKQTQRYRCVPPTHSGPCEARHLGGVAVSCLRGHSHGAR